MNAVIVLILALSPQGPTGTTLERIEREISAVIEKARPSTVQITAQFRDEAFENTIAPPRSLQLSGVIVSADGHILTDLGGLEQAREIFVTLHDGRRFPAELKASDRPSAVALLRIAVTGVKPAEFADESAIRQGAIAVLVSNPLGLNQSSSVGFVTGTNRSIGVRGQRFDGMLQTSAAVQSGDGGGLLANSRGQVLGMIHSRYVPDGLEPDAAGFIRPIPRNGVDFLPAGGPAVGFATPAPTLKFVAERLMRHGRVQRAWAGLGLQRAGTVTHVVEVTRNGPAWKAGIRRGDIVLEFDGQSADDLPALRRRVMESDIQRTVRVKLQRGPATQELDVTLTGEPGP